MSHHLGYAPSPAKQRGAADHRISMSAKTVLTDIGALSIAGRSALRSWLVAILKHKIVDLVRERCAHHSLDAMQDDDGGDGSADDAHTPLALVCPQAGPQDLAEHRQQLHTVLTRIRAPPEGLRRVMELRVL